MATVDDSGDMVTLPIDAKVLSTGMQPDGLYVWALVDTSGKYHRDVKFFIIPTGHTPPSEDTDFVGTILDGFYVWHIFVEKGYKL
jgi:hypothetical protein